MAGLLLLPLLTGAFAPSSYGNYALALTAYAWLDAAAVSWFGSVIIRFYAPDLDEQARRRLDGTLFALILLVVVPVALVCLIALFAARAFIAAELFDTLLCTIPLLLAAGLLELPLNVLRVRDRLALYNALIVARIGLAPLAGLGFTLLWNGGVAGLMSGQAVFIWALAPLAYGALYGLPRLRLFSLAQARALLAFGVPLLPSALLVLLLAAADRLIIGAFRGSDEVGVYAVAYDLASLPLVLLSGLLIRALAPSIVAAWQRGGRDAAARLQGEAVRAYLLLGVPAVVGLGMLAGDLLAVLAAPAYRAGAVIFWPVALGAFCYGLQLIAQRGLILAKRTRPILRAFLRAGAMNIGANLALAPLFGYVAAAWTTLASYILLLLLIARGSAPYLALELPRSGLLRVGVASTAMLVALWLVPEMGGVIGLALKIAVGAGVYGLALLLLGEFGLRRGKAAPDDHQQRQQRPEEDAGLSA